MGYWRKLNILPYNYYYLNMPKRNKNKSTSRAITRALKTGGAAAANSLLERMVPGLRVNVKQKKRKARTRPLSLGGGITLSGSGSYRTNRVVSGSGSYSAVNGNIEGGARNSAVYLGGTDETGRVVISKTEYLCDVFSPGSNNFTNTAYNMNPGWAGTFPWLSQVATNYTKWKPLKVLYEFIPTLSYASTTGAMGTIMFAFNYNAGEGPFASKAQMIEYCGSVSRVLNQSIMLGVECDPDKLGSPGAWFVRAGPVPEGQDIKTYDLGTFQVAVSGIDPAVFPVGTQIGMIKCHYQIELSQPRLWDSLGNNIPMDIFLSGAGNTATRPLGALATPPLMHPDSDLGCSVQSDGVGFDRVLFPDAFQGELEITILMPAGLTGGAATYTLGPTVTLAVDIPTRNNSIDAITNVGAFEMIQSGVRSWVIRLNVARAEVSGESFFDFTLTSITNGTGVTMIIKQINPTLPGKAVSAYGVAPVCPVAHSP